MTHPCPVCGRSILGNRYLCMRCFDRLTRADQHRLRQQFQGTADDYLAVQQVLETLATQHTKETA